MYKKRIIAILIIAVALVAAWLLWPLGSSAKPQLEVAFLDVVDDSAGQRVARFTVTNVSELPVIRESGGRVEYQIHPNLVPSIHVAEPTQILPGKSEIVMAPVPKNHGP